MVGISEELGTVRAAVDEIANDRATDARESRIPTTHGETAKDVRTEMQTDDYVYWARYAIEDGRVRPISFRYSGPFVVGWAVLVGLAGVMLLSIWRGWNARGDSRR